MRKLTHALLALLTVTTVACSEKGLAPESPVSPGSVGATEAKGGGKPAADTAVTTTIQGIAGGTFDIASDGVGAYTTSVIQSVGAWLLDLAGTNRTVYLRVVNNDTDLTGHYKARLIAQCNRAPYNQSMLAMDLDEVIQCPLYVRFEAPTGSYRITMNSSEPTATGSNDVNIRCTAAGTGGLCTAWQIEPNGLNGAGVGVLDKQGRGTTWIGQGAFTFAFVFNVTKP